MTLHNSILIYYRKRLLWKISKYTKEERTLCFSYTAPPPFNNYQLTADLVLLIPPFIPHYLQDYFGASPRTQYYFICKYFSIYLKGKDSL